MLPVTVLPMLFVRWREGRRQLALPLKADETKPIIYPFSVQ